jgi:poly(ribitol-phosphate) beta-N-acetylglucosaminyltransferase
LGHRWNVRVEVDAFNSSGSAALRGARLTSWARLVRRHGRCLFLVNVVKDASGHILIAVIPLTPRRLIAKLRKAVGLG